MNQDSYTEITSESWLSRLGGAIKGFLFGTALFVLAFPLLFWNEGRAVKRAKALHEGAAVVVSVPANEISPVNSGKLVQVTGKATTSEKLVDPIFRLSANAIHLRRVVSMYQWQENSDAHTTKKLGGSTETSTTYTYAKNWNEGLIDSSRFKHPEGHQNPPMPCTSDEWSAKQVHLSAFQLGPSLVAKLTLYTPVAAAKAGTISNALLGVFNPINDGFYRGRNSAAPELGDIHVTFQAVEPAEVSIVAQQAGTTLAPYATQAGSPIELLQNGTYSAAEMFKSAEQINKRLTWILRGVGLLLMVIGLSMVLKPLSVLADVVPFFGNIVQAGTGLIAFLVSLTLSFITVAVAWIVYRPVLGIALLVIASGVVYVLKGRLGRTKRENIQPTARSKVLETA
jgi:hypothetical protein